MATLAPSAIWLRRGAFAAGLVAAVTVVFLGRIVPGHAPPALDLAITTHATGELAVAPAGRVGGAVDLRPGSAPVRAPVRLQNQTNARLAVRLRGRASIADADSSLMLRVTGPGGVLYSGTAGGFRSFSPNALTLAPNSQTTFVVTAWLPAGASDGWRARRVTVPIEYRTEVAGKVRG